MTFSSVGKNPQSHSVTTNVTIGEPQIVGSATAQAKAFLSQIKKQVDEFNQMPLEGKLNSNISKLVGGIGQLPESLAKSIKL